jgi:peptidoglycan/LPS O-acetylase OafA/YrhL
MNFGGLKAAASQPVEQQQQEQYRSHHSVPSETAKEDHQNNENENNAIDQQQPQQQPQRHCTCCCSLYSVAWIVGFLVYVAPAAIPSFERYRYEYSFYVLVIFCCCVGLFSFVLSSIRQRHNRCNNNDDDDDDDKKDDEEEQRPELQQEHGEEEEEEVQPQSPPRIYFLDNIKFVLTVSVLLHHLYGGFGSDPDVVLKIGVFDTNYWAKGWDNLALGPISLFFMSLFYFISAYFVPVSVKRKGPLRFIKERTRRIMFGALVATLIFMPLAIFWALHFPYGDEVLSYYHYRPAAGATWFLWWLFLFNIWYATTTSTTNNSGDNRNKQLPLSKYFTKFPSKFYHRWMIGILVGYVDLAARALVFDGSGAFGSMPNTYNSFVCYPVSFYVGLLAGQNQWFYPTKHPTIRRQLGMNVWLFRLWVVGLYLVIVTAQYGVYSIGQWPVYSQFFLRGAVAGLWLVEVSVCVLEIFQTNFDCTNAVWSFGSRWSYGAYLLQNVMIYTMPVALFVYAYNASNPVERIVFDDSITSTTPIPMLSLITVGWFYSTIVYIPLCCIVSYLLGQLPLLKYIL